MLIRLILLLLLLPSAQAQTWLGTPENYRGLVKNLAPGDILELTPGDYREGLSIHHKQGSAEQPIVIRGQDASQRPVFWARGGANTVSLLNSSYVTIQNLILDGATAPHVDGVKAEGHAQWTHHITLEKLLIRNHNAGQQTVGISTKCPSWNWVIRDNEIIGAGTGIYLGDSDGSDAFVDGLIEYNLIADTIGYNLQIKHQKNRVIEQESHGTIIRHNVFVKQRSAEAARGAARPNVLVGHFPLSGAGSHDRYWIYGNFFYDNPSEVLFQGEGNIALYNNILVNPHGSAIHIQPHNDVPRDIAIFANTIVATKTGVALKGLAADAQQWVQANAIFAQHNQFAHLKTEANLGAPEAVLTTHKLGKLTGKFPLDKFASYPDGDKDYKLRPRHGKYRGAYEAEEVNWLPPLQMKKR